MPMEESHSLRESFQEQQFVTWLQFCDILKGHMRAWTGLNLDESHLECLRVQLQNAGIPLNPISLTKVYDEKLIYGDFSFWTWLSTQANIFKSEYFKNLWEQGYIIPFMTKGEAERLLTESNKAGTFIVRCSETTLGSLSISFISGGSVMDVKHRRVVVNLKTDDSLNTVEFINAIYKTKTSYFENGVKVVKPAFLQVYPGTEKGIAFPPIPLNTPCPPLHRWSSQGCAQLTSN